LVEGWKVEGLKVESWKVEEEEEEFQVSSFRFQNHEPRNQKQETRNSSLPLVIRHSSFVTPRIPHSAIPNPQFFLSHHVDQL
jgi:hypothetical protein